MTLYDCRIKSDHHENVGFWTNTESSVADLQQMRRSRPEHSHGAPDAQADFPQMVNRMFRPIEREYRARFPRAETIERNHRDVAGRRHNELAGRKLRFSLRLIQYRSADFNCEGPVAEIPPRPAYLLGVARLCPGDGSANLDSCVD